MSGKKIENNKYELGGLYHHGCEVFEKARHLKLDTQERNEDPVHQKLLNKMERGERLVLEDLWPYQVLGSETSKEDAQEPSRSKKKACQRNETSGRNNKQKSHQNAQESIDPLTWYKAPMLVATNRERYNLLEVQARHFALAMHNYVFHWRSKTSCWRGKPEQPAHVEEVIRTDPVFWEYFVKGAVAYGLDNANKPRKIINGTQYTYEELIFSDASQECKARLQMATAACGEVITLEEPPFAIIVQAAALHKDDGWTNLSMDNEGDKVVIPMLDLCRDSKGESLIVNGGVDYLLSTITVQNRFPLEPGFVITVHKAQGRTLRRIIIALSEWYARKCNFTYVHLYVAMSRVKRGCDIRLLIHTDVGGDVDWDTISYVTTLRPNPAIKAYFTGFKDTEGHLPKWNKELAIAAMEAYVASGEL